MGTRDGGEDAGGGGMGMQVGVGVIKSMWKQQKFIIYACAWMGVGVGMGVGIGVVMWVRVGM